MVSLLKVCRLLNEMGADRRRLAVEAQRRRVTRSIVENETRRRGLN